ncbi:MAG TPA: TylF/MycF/NovP-related O-methyltransferase [Vicinamibacterales bacterium]|jgi:O-methyltransferase|nr:TylF/MycF/NovP-related O-methyltransferase [Vicinamibacterales bacterium]
MSLLIKLPWFRRYAIENAKLRSKLAASREQVRELLERQERMAQDAEFLRQAREHEYYWREAFKRIDIRQLMPFGDVAARVIGDGRTYLNVDRLYTLWQAVDWLPAAAQAVAEVGVYRGGSAWFVAEALRRRQREIPFYVCDTFQGHVEVDESLDGLHRPGEQFTRVKAEKVAKYLRGFSFVRVEVGDIRDTAPTFAAERRFGLVHLDVDVYPITRYCLEFFGPRMVSGGVIVADDYGTTTCEGVKKAVDEFVVSNTGFRVLHLLTGQAVVTKLGV